MGIKFRWEQLCDFGILIETFSSYVENLNLWSKCWKILGRIPLDDRVFIHKLIWWSAARRKFAFSAALALALTCLSSLAADQPSHVDGPRPKPTAPIVMNPALKNKEVALSPVDKKVLFPATRYPFVPTLSENRDPELCSSVLKGARQEFFSDRISILSPIGERDGIEWLNWNDIQDAGFRFRLDLDLDGNGQVHPVVGRVVYGPGSRMETIFHVFASDEALENEVGSADPDKMFDAHFTSEQGEDLRLFRWKNRYYFFDNPSRFSQANVPKISAFRLNGDGSVASRCTVRISPDESIVLKLRGEPGFKSFLKVISTIGDQGPSGGTMVIMHNWEANAAVDRAAFRPWAVSRATKDPDDVLDGSYFRYNERMKRFLEDWSFLDVWSRREYQTFLQHIDPAVTALEKYYVSAFGLTTEKAKKAARRVVEEVIAAWILVPKSYDPELDLYNLRRPLLNRPVFSRDRDALKEVLRREKERRPDGSSDKVQSDWVDPFSPSSYDRKRPDIEISFALHVAVEWEEGMRLLLAAGADPNALNEFGKTPLMTAAHMNRPDTVRLLLSHGADPNRKTVEMKSWMGLSPIRRTALMYAAENAGTAVMKLLLDAGASPDERDSKGDGIETYLARNPRLTDAEKRMDIRKLVRSSSGLPIEPSFDCNKAKSLVEKSICGDEVLKMFDGEMANAFRRWVHHAGDEARNDQRRWLKIRNTSCTDKNEKVDLGCLQDQTRSRVRYLHNRLTEYESNDGKLRN
jgi:uncharacterized protein YecT (DUF1311 family)